MIAPGFMDRQVNGFAGHDAAAGAGGIAGASERLPAPGGTGFLPTLISAPVEQGAAFAAAVGAASEAQGARVLGAHIEGPFLNPSFRGAHLRSHLALPDPERVDVLLAAGPRLVTLAPELPGALTAIERFHNAGIVVSAGHTAADFEQGRKAIAAGVRFGTHISHAMPSVQHRRPGIALALLLDPRVTVGLIADGEHVHPSVCEQLVRVKGESHIALTTDQTSAAGAPPGSYSLSGRPVVSDGKVARLEDGTLAGSAATMPDLIRLMARLPGMSAARAITLASTVPAARRHAGPEGGQGSPDRPAGQAWARPPGRLLRRGCRRRGPGGTRPPRQVARGDVSRLPPGRGPRRPPGAGGCRPGVRYRLDRGHRLRCRRADDGRSPASARGAGE